jgi:hypothetical protein
MNVKNFPTPFPSTLLAQPRLYFCDRPSYGKNELPKMTKIKLLNSLMELRLQTRAELCQPTGNSVYYNLEI